ncbi:MAG TPA: hypothetical protein VHC70_06480 [Phycisphaerales bacterium]|jgi:hypothetical protein|nr:hypothetical protein [Phycisphaerales bacterium]
MSLFGPATPASLQPVSGVPPAERKPRASRQPKSSDGVSRGSDEVDVSAALATDAVRDLKSNGDEETTDDRQEQDNYKPQKKPEPRKPLDVQG